VFRKQKQKTETIQKTNLKAMKTTNNAQKTENRKFKNTISKTFAVVASLVLISLTVSANGFWKQILVNNAYGKMAVLMVGQNNSNNTLVMTRSTAEISADSFYAETEKDKALPIESWMTSDKTFRSNMIFNQVSTEKNLEIESWMLDNQYFSEPVVANDSEPALEIENWMTDPLFWNKQN